MKNLLFSLFMAFSMFSLISCGDEDSKEVAEQTEEVAEQTEEVEEVQKHCIDGTYSVQGDIIWNYFPSDSKYILQIASSAETTLVHIQEKSEEGDDDTLNAACSEFARVEDGVLKNPKFRKKDSNDKGFSIGISELSIKKNKFNSCELENIAYASSPENMEREKMIIHNEKNVNPDYESLKKECDAYLEVVLDNDEEKGKEEKSTEQS